MIATSPPYELLVLLADQDALAFLCGLIERGQKGGCLRAFRWHPQRNAKGHHDDFWRHSEELLPPGLPSTCRVLALWDHHGSGREKITPEAAEGEATRLLERQNIELGRIFAVALQPELEVLLWPVWDRVKDVLAQERKTTPPGDDQILHRAQRLNKGPIPRSLTSEEALRRHPKEMLESLRQLLHLGTLSTVHQILGERLSIERLKGHCAHSGDAPPERPAGRIARQLVTWFPGPQAPSPAISP